VLLLILLAPLVEPSLQARILQISDTQRLQKAWQAATAIGRFHYQTNAQQTTHPTISLKNAGRQSKTKQFRVEGDIDLRNERMILHLHTNQGRQERVTELKVENGQAFGRLQTNAEWTPIDQTLDLFAPGGDPMGFLAAAENVVETRDWRLETGDRRSEIRDWRSEIRDWRLEIGDRRLWLACGSIIHVASNL